MSNFDNIMNDKLKVFDFDGNLIKDTKGSVQKNKIFIMDGSFLIKSGYTIERTMSNGGLEKYKVINPGFYEKLGGIPSHYQMQVEILDN